jgi:hypothetical protein
MVLAVPPNHILMPDASLESGLQLQCKRREGTGFAMPIFGNHTHLPKWPQISLARHMVNVPQGSNVTFSRYIGYVRAVTLIINDQRADMSNQTIRYDVKGSGVSSIFLDPHLCVETAEQRWSQSRHGNGFHLKGFTARIQPVFATWKWALLLERSKPRVQNAETPGSAF